jgi:hypothetical protein
VLSTDHGAIHALHNKWSHKSTETFIPIAILSRQIQHRLLILQTHSTIPKLRRIIIAHLQISSDTEGKNVAPYWPILPERHIYLAPRGKFQPQASTEALFSSANQLVDPLLASPFGSFPVIPAQPSPGYTSQILEIEGSSYAVDLNLAKLGVSIIYIGLLHSKPPEIYK